MKPPLQPTDEPRRLEALQQHNVLDIAPEQALHDRAALAAPSCEAPISLLTLADENRRWAKSKVGLSASETPRESSFCRHATLQPDVSRVPDPAPDGRSAGNPLVTGPPLREASRVSGRPTVMGRART